MKPEKCEWKCKVCRVKDCCGNCVFGGFYSVKVGPVDSVLYDCKISCELKLAPGSTVVKGKPVFTQCKQWKPRYPEVFK